jgi:inner membrane protein YidH
MSDASDVDVTRRTRLAAERTWLAWWRSGIAASTAAVAVGGVVPELVGGSRAPYVVLGVGYGLLAAAVFLAAGLRRVTVARALERGEYAEVGERTVGALTFVGFALALGTIAIIIIQP